MTDRREKILNQEHRKFVESKGVSCIYPADFPQAYKDAAINAMDEYSKEWEGKYRKANQFICDLGKLIGLDGLGYDDIKVSIEDFRDGLDEKKKEMCLLFLEYVAHETTGHSFNKTKDELEFKYKGEWITREKLFENFL